jgi:uncharacterized protein YjiS (DUF1127 family)
METHTARSLLQVHGIHSSPARATGLIASSFNAIMRAARGLTRRHRERRGIEELLRMDDRLLADIGITRGEAEHMVRNGRWSQVLPATGRKHHSAPIGDKELGERA